MINPDPTRQIFPPSQQNSAAASLSPVITPERAGVLYNELRAAHAPLPTNIAEEQNLPPTYKVFSFALDNLTTDTRLDIRGNYFKIINSTNATDLVQVRVGNITNDQIPCNRGMGFNDVYFESLFLSWAATAGAVAKIIVIYDPRNVRLNSGV